MADPKPSRRWLSLILVVMLGLLVAAGIWAIRMLAGGSIQYWSEKSEVGSSELRIRRMDSSSTEERYEITLRVRATTGNQITSCRLILFDDRDRDFRWREGDHILFEQTLPDESLVDVVRIGPAIVTWQPAETRFPTVMMRYEVNHSTTFTKHSALYNPTLTTQPAPPESQ